MSFPTGSLTNPGQRRTQSRSRGQQLGLGIVGFLGGIVAAGAFWWIGIGPQQKMSLYWLTTPDNDIYYVEQERSFRATDSEQAISASLQQLISGSGDPQLISAVPKDTRILSVKVEGEDIFLNFSPEFTSGGGATTMLGRITQILYTATSQNEHAKVWISVNGKALDVLSGEGLMLDQPLTRNSFQPSFQNEESREPLQQTESSPIPVSQPTSP